MKLRALAAIEGAQVLAVGLVLLATFAWLYLPWLPTADGRMGADYALFVPNLLAGYYWYLENGAFALPWFSPGECGGVPFFADPNVPWFSVPQMLTFLIPPVAAVRATVLAFALAGFVGAYGLLRRSFRASMAASVVGGALFMFNGFYAARMLVGHFAFHPFMLAPAFCLAVLPVGPVAWPRAILRVGAAGLILAVMLQAGMVHVVPAVLLGAAMIAVLHGMRFGFTRFLFWALPTAMLLAALLAAGKMAALTAFVVVFPRDSYSLPGFPDLVDELATVLRALFIAVPDDAQAHLRNVTWAQDQYEFEIGITIVPLLLMATAVTQWRPRRAQGRHIWPVAGLLVLGAIPLLANWYEPHWNTVLKSLPYFRNSSNLLRWNATFILPAILLGALALDRIAVRHALLAGSAVALALALVAARDRTVYDGVYQSIPVEQAWHVARQNGHPPAITAIAVSSALTAARRRADLNVNNAITVGYSHRQCYQPMFGYGNENLPLANLTPTAVLTETQGLLNLKNPACYLFPQDNHCLPGAMFEVREREAAQAFAAWKPFPFVLPAYMHRILIANQLALLATLASMAGAGLVLWRRAATR